VRSGLGTIVLLGAVLVLVAMLAGAPHANPLLAWIIEDTGAVGWGQGGGPPHWEWMTLFPDVNSAGPYQDLDPDNPYYACFPPVTGNWGVYRFGATIWFANNYEDSHNTVVVELRKGSWYNEGMLLATDSAVVDNAMPAKSYGFYFGVHWGPSMIFDDESLVVKIVYLGPGGDTHIYWDGPNYPSHLYGGATTATEKATWGRIKALYER